MAVAFTQFSGLMTVLTTDKNIYTLGEPVRISLFKLNISLNPITVVYPTSQRFDFSAANLGGEVWRWSYDKIFAQVTQMVTLFPGQTEFYSEIWPQVDFNGDRVLSGIYRVTGWNTFQGYTGFPWPAIFIRIGI